MSLFSQKLLMAAAGNVSTEILPESVDFDGTNDYLSRASDFTGNADGKEFTFSAFMYKAADISAMVYGNGNYRFYIQPQNDDNLRIIGANSAGATIIQVSIAVGGVPQNTFYHLLVSVDLTNSSNRYVFINDADITADVTWTTYTNDSIDFTQTVHAIGADHTAANKFEGRLSHVYMDYTYRDISVEATRRNWITADLKPADSATLAALNPIMYFPLTDPTTAHINLGTGGNMTLNGTVALSERGPNQDNCVASVFDGSADYLSKTGISISGKTYTISFILKETSGNVFTEHDSGAYRLRFYPVGDIFYVRGYNASNTQILQIEIPYIIAGRTSAISISFDLSSTSNRVVFINGNEVIPTYSIYINDTIGEGSDTNVAHVNGASPVNGSLGEFYFDTTYTDLSTSNPFWDSDTNKPVPVRQVIENTGVTPLIAMPIRGDNAGLNLGSGGDFTVNSGPYPGARGASEFWARSAKFDGSTGYLSRGALTGASDSKTFSLQIFLNKSTNLAYEHVLGFDDTTTGVIGYMAIQGDNTLFFRLGNAAGTRIIGFTSNAALTVDTNYIIQISCDLTTTAKRNVYINGAAISVTWNYYVDDYIKFTGDINEISTRGESTFFTGIISSIYFTTDYIDFSQEANRLLFVDAFGYPTDLQQKIDDGEVPEPLIYLPFNDTSDLGKNNGTGGDFTVNGTVTAGADVDPNA